MKKINYLIILLVIILWSCNNKDSNITENSNYQIDVQLDSSAMLLNCKLNLQWNNNSDQIIDKIPLNFSLDSLKTLIKKVTVNGQNTRVSYQSKEFDEFEGIVLELDKPIRPYKRATIRIEFQTKSKQYFREKILFFTEDFPLVQYFENGAFNPNYQVHSNYKVNISYPLAYQMASTGVHSKTDTINGFAYTKTSVQDVPSYGLLFFKDLLVKEATVNEVLIRSFYFKSDRKWGERLLSFSEEIISFFENKLGFYPQKIINIVPGESKPYGGWPIAPNIVGIHRGIDMKKKPNAHAKWIMAHEIGHQYWGYNHVLDPINYPQWLGIGMGIYTDWLYTKEKKVDKNYNKFFYYFYAKGVKEGHNTTIMQTTKSLEKQNFDWNNIILHGKSWAVLRLLEQELGENVFFEVFKYGLDNYKGVNVTLEMFKKDCERISQKKLDTFFDIWFYSNAFLDYQINEVTTTKKGNRVMVEGKINKIGEASVSEIQLTFVLSNKDTILTSIDGNQKQFVFKSELDYPPVKIILDPEFVLPLVNRKSWIKK